MRESFVHMPPGNPAFTTLPKIGASPTLGRRTNMFSGPAPGENATLPRAERSLGGVGVGSRLNRLRGTTVRFRPNRRMADWPFPLFRITPS